MVQVDYLYAGYSTCKYNRYRNFGHTRAADEASEAPSHGVHFADGIEVNNLDKLKL